jgi:hypothetical protein
MGYARLIWSGEKDALLLPKSVAVCHDQKRSACLRGTVFDKVLQVLKRRDVVAPEARVVEAVCGAVS